MVQRHKKYVGAALIVFCGYVNIVRCDVRVRVPRRLVSGPISPVTPLPRVVPTSK